MTNELNLNNYYEEYSNKINPEWLFKKLELAKNKILETKKNGGKLIFAGNGASAAIASHCALDFTKQAKIKSVTFHDPALFTAFVNDFGDDQWISQACEMYANPDDLAIFISVSGESSNVVNAARSLSKRGIETITFSGKFEHNSISKEGVINFWVDSHAYNIVECIHMIWITSIIDMIIGKSEYEVS